MQLAKSASVSRCGLSTRTRVQAPLRSKVHSLATK